MARRLIEVEILDETPGEGGRLGRHVVHDPKSREHDVARDAAAPFVREPILWERLSPILDQGNLPAQGIHIVGPDGAEVEDLGSCTGNALTAWLGCAPHVHNVTAAAAYDEMFAINLYSAATKLDPFDGHYPPEDTGSSGLAVAKAAKRAGIIAGYRWAFSTESLVRALRRGPVIVGAPWFSGFDRPDHRGRVTATGSIRGGHEWLIRGWTPDPGGAGTDGLLHCDNSWGEGWGIHGSFAFSTRTWEVLRRLRADVVSPVL